MARRKRRRGGFVRYSPEAVQAALDMMASGKTMKETAVATGASLATLTNWKRAARKGARASAAPAVSGTPRRGRPAASRAGNGASAVDALMAVVKMGLSESDMAKFQNLLNAYIKG